MATRNVKLTDTLDRFVEDRVGSGEYQNASEVVRAGLRLLKSQIDHDQRKLQRYRTLVQEGLNDLDAGRYEVVDDLDQLLARMTPESFPEEVDFGPPQGREIW